MVRRGIIIGERNNAETLQTSEIRAKIAVTRTYGRIGVDVKTPSCSAVTYSLPRCQTNTCGVTRHLVLHMHEIMGVDFPIRPFMFVFPELNTKNRSGRKHSFSRMIQPPRCVNEIAHEIVRLHSGSRHVKLTASAVLCDGYNYRVLNERGYMSRLDCNNHDVCKYLLFIV